MESVKVLNEEKADMVTDVDVNSEPVVGAMLHMSRSGGKSKLTLENHTQTIGSPAKKMRLCDGSNFNISLGFWSNLDGGISTALCSDNKTGGELKKNGKWN